MRVKREEEKAKERVDEYWRERKQEGEEGYRRRKEMEFKRIEDKKRSVTKMGKIEESMIKKMMDTQRRIESIAKK